MPCADGVGATDTHTLRRADDPVPLDLVRAELSVRRDRIRPEASSAATSSGVFQSQRHMVFSSWSDEVSGSGRAEPSPELAPVVPTHVREDAEAPLEQLPRRGSTVVGSATRHARQVSVALIVEDASARERLKRHLSGHFRALMEAVSATEAAGLSGPASVDAFVFVRPRADDELQRGLAALRAQHRAVPPVILVLSSDTTFDALPGVNLRMPLGQRASEVAQQVLDGLERLGIDVSTLQAEP